MDYKKEKIFADGLIVKRKENAPDFVKHNLAFKVDDFVKFLRDNDKKGWVNVDVKESKGGKLYAELDTFEPQKQKDIDF